MIKTKDGYAKLIENKFTGNEYSLLKSNGDVWEVNKNKNNEINKIVRTDTEGSLPVDILKVSKQIYLDKKDAIIYRLGASSQFYNGRDTALIKTTSYSSNSTIYSIKSSGGSWDMSVSSNKLKLYYISDSCYINQSGISNTDYYELTFPERSGTLALISDVPVFDIIAGGSRATTSAGIKDPYINLTSKIIKKDGSETISSLGQVRLKGVGSTTVNSDSSDNVTINSIIYKAGTGLETVDSGDTVITKTINVKLGYQSSNDKYAVQNHTSGLFVQVPWRTISIEGASISRKILNFVQGNNISFTKNSYTNSDGNEVLDLTINAHDTLYTAGPGLTLTNLQFKVNAGTDDKVNRIYGVEVGKTEGDPNYNNLYVTTPWIEYTNGDGITITNSADDKYSKVITHGNTSNVDTTKAFGPTTKVTGSDSNTINIPQLQVDDFGHVVALKEYEYTSKDTTYEFADGENCFYVTPLNGTKKTVKVTPITKDFIIKADSTELCNYDGTEKTTITFKVKNNLKITGDTSTGIIEIDGEHTHNYAGSSEPGGAANSVKKELIVQIKKETFEELYKYNGSEEKKLTFVAGENVSIEGTTTGTVKISAIDTTYKVGNQLTLSEDGKNTINLTVIEGLTKGKYGTKDDTVGSNNTTIKIPYFTINEYGRIIECKDITYTSVDTIYGATDGIMLDTTEGKYKHTNSIDKKTKYGSTKTTASSAGGTIIVTDIKYDDQGHITESTDRTITLSQDHVKNTVGKEKGTDVNGGSVITIPYITTNSDGHVANLGTFKHTITGFVTSITPGIGLTGTEGDSAITTSGTINLIAATNTELGGIKIGYSTSATNQNYAVSLDTSNKAYVKVPWTDKSVTSVSTHYSPTTDSTKQLDASTTTTTNITTSSNAVNVVVGLQRDAAGHVTGVVSKKIYSTDENTRYSNGTGLDLSAANVFSLKTAGVHGTNGAQIGGIKVAKDNSSYSVTVNTSSISSNVTAGKYYGVEIDKNDKAFVYVPWEKGSYTLPAASSSNLGGIKIGYSENGYNYAVQLNNQNQAYVNVPWENSWRPITNTYYGTSTSTSLSQKGAKQLYDDLHDLIPSDLSLTETGSSYQPIYIDDEGVPTQCSSKYRGSLHFTSGSSGTVYCYQFGPIVILQGHIRNIDTTKTSVSNYLFTLPDSCPAPQDVMGFAIVQRNGYSNDRNTVIRISTSGIGYVDPYYSDYSIDGNYSKYGYYLQVCYII